MNKKKNTSYVIENPFCILSQVSKQQSRLGLGDRKGGFTILIQQEITNYSYPLLQIHCRCEAINYTLHEVFNLAVLEGCDDSQTCQLINRCAVVPLVQLKDKSVMYTYKNTMYIVLTN